MKQFFSLFAAILFTGSMFATNFSLEQVTAVEAGKSYVFVRNAHALKAEVKSSKLQTTADFLTENLEGTENYVWVLEAANGGFYIKAAEGKYVANTSSTSVSLSNSASSIWVFEFSGEKVVLKNKSNGNRFLGETSVGSNEYKAYAEAGHPNDFTVFVLKEEDPSKPAISAKAIDFGSVTIENDVDNFELDTTLEVTAANLTAPIEVTNGENVTATEASLPAEGGTLHLHIVAAPGAFEDTIQLASGELAIKVAVIGSVKQKKAPGASGEFIAYTDEIVEGDYIIVSGSDAMKAAELSERIAFAAVEIEEGVISTEDASIIWHIAKSGDYWTIYNAEEELYAASTGAKNKAALIEDGSDDKALWTVSVDEGEFEFVNKANDAKAVNANLRQNGNFGFACYSTSTGSPLSLFKGNPKPTAVDNTNAEVKAEKFFRNGQLIIRKNGVEYNVTGAIVK